jgi:hypothetical protein
MANSTTNLDQVAPSQLNPGDTANSLFDAASPATVYGRRAYACSGLTWGYFGGAVLVGSVPTEIANGTVLLTASTTNYIRKQDSTGAVSVTTSFDSSWPAPNGGYTPLYDVTTGAASATSWNDWRTSATVSSTGSGTAPSGTGFRHVTSGTEDGTATAVNLSGSDVTGTLAAARMPALTGDVTTSAGAVATTIASGVVSNAKLATMATHTFKGNNTGSTAAPLDLTATQLTAELNAVVGDSGSGGTKGLVPAPGAGDAAAGKFLKADGTFAVPAGAGDMVLASTQVVTGLKTFGTAGGAVGKFALAGSTSGSTVLDASAVASGTATLPAGTYEVGFRNIPQNSQSTAYTTVLDDKGKHLLHPAADTTARTFTIDSNANVAYPIGTAITFVNENSAGVLTISITSDTMRLAGAGTTGSRTLAANGIATALKIGTTSWIISGTNLT